MSGAGGAIGDIGTHAVNLAEFVCGDTVAELLADLQSFVAGRRVDDNAQMLLRFASGARGSLWASQVAPGHENGLRIRVYGATGSLTWAQEDPNYLHVARLGETPKRLTRGSGLAGSDAQRVTRIPGGHPEGYLEAFATIYSEVAQAIRAHAAGKKPDAAVTFPGLADGMRGVAFIEAAIRSSRANAAWQHVAG